MDIDSLSNNTGPALGLSLNSPMSENHGGSAKGALHTSRLEPLLTLGHDGFGGGGSSFSNTSGSEESEKVCYAMSRVISRNSSGHDGRKKLRLTRSQSSLLEEAFKLHSSLNPKLKQELAKELKLRPRQVEVWFQNRRARTKLKQTETDCEYIKKYYKALMDENQRLQKELQELKTQNPNYMQLPGATLTKCPSCEPIGDTTSAAGKASFTVAPKPRFFNPFTTPSAAC